METLMAELTSQDMAAKLLAEGFQRSGPAATALSDPLADTPMVVTLDELRPYELNPRVTRNPLYEDIKASIRERGLDAPPAITRRPGESHYIIRNGGNTRLAILRELWSDTREERFFRIACLFRPWSARGEIVALTGHLAENELHGGLSFIERALGVEKARELYEQEDGQPLTQTELSRRLSADGYPITQPHISRMQEAVRYLLPAIPHLLYGGLGRPQIERLTGLRRAGARLWDARSDGRSLPIEFATLFQEMLSTFDGGPDALSIARLEDELVGQMAEYLGIDYDTLLFDLRDSENRQRALTEAPAGSATAPDAKPGAHDHTSSVVPTTPAAPTALPSTTSAITSDSAAAPADHASPANGTQGSPARETNDSHSSTVASPASTTRLDTIQRMVAEQLGEERPDFTQGPLRAIPIQVDALYPITDIWYIDAGLDAPVPLRTHIAQFAREIGAEAGLNEGIDDIAIGIGYRCSPGRDDAVGFRSAVARLLHALGSDDPANGIALTSLLLGADTAITRLSDDALIKLFRLIRLARRLRDHERGTGAFVATA
jgi:ParB family protein of integrating conjugative element (PFGI_1 class)